MANEITILAELRFNKGASAAGLPFGPATFSMTGTRYLRGRQNVGLAEEALILGDVGVGGWIFIVNRDAANFVSYRSAAGVTPTAKIPANGCCGPFVIHPSSTAPTVQADTAACEIEVLLLQP